MRPGEVPLPSRGSGELKKAFQHWLRIPQYRLAFPENAILRRKVASLLIELDIVVHKLTRSEIREYFAFDKKQRRYHVDIRL